MTSKEDGQHRAVVSFAQGPSLRKIEQSDFTLRWFFFHPQCRSLLAPQCDGLPQEKILILRFAERVSMPRFVSASPAGDCDSYLAVI